MGMVRAVPTKAAAVRHRRSLTIATPASPIGSLVGVSQRRLGVVRTRARAVQERQEVVHEAERNSSSRGVRMKCDVSWCVTLLTFCMQRGVALSRVEAASALALAPSSGVEAIELAIVSLN